ncbi:hypothetical protein QBC43DRAFT_114683 [Cladorrhinum sp. PSN259]|nr:hypothetical protein QBC43DRAFT_114683 [Cladorrhinum sp. PSN259]
MDVSSHRGNTCTQRTSWDYRYDEAGDDDAISPCPRESMNQDRAHHQNHHKQHKEDGHMQAGRPRTQRSSAASSWRSGRARPLSGFVDDEEDTEVLWHQMLAVQDRFGCYNSARMRAALEGGRGMRTPSRTCLDLINDSIGEMPEDIKQRIELFLEREGTGSYWKMGKWRRFWHRVIYA